MQLPVVTFDQADARQRGRAHGEIWRAEIHALAEIRTELAVRKSALASAEEVLTVAGMHLPVLAEQAPDLHAELLGIAEGADLGPERVVVLNCYTDLRDVPRSVLGGPDSPAPTDGDPGGCTAIYFAGDDGPVLGQTWDMHATAEPFVRLVRVAPRGGEEETLCFTLTGCLGMAGIGRHGVAVTINNLSCTDARVGLPWPALVRLMLRQPDAARARAVLEAAPRAGGHHYVIADGRDYYGFECSGELAVLTQLGPRAAHLHTNHCFDPVLRQRERVHPRSSTFDRLNMATTLYAQQRPRTAEELWALLGSHDGEPRSICSHLDALYGDPSASKTCGRMLMVLERGEIWASAGCSRAGSRVVERLHRFAPPGDAGVDSRGA